MNRKLKIAAVAAALLVAVSFSAMALVSTHSNPGRLVAIHQEIKDFFAARGANAAYLGMAKSEVPAAEWAKIQALMDATTTTDDPVCMDLGNHRWIHEQDTDDD